VAFFASVVLEHGVVFADDDPPAAHQAISEFTGPETCVKCHLTAAQEVVESLHYQQQGFVPYREGWDAEVFGGMAVAYGIPPASVASINWLGILQPVDESLPAQPSGCALCHPGLGSKPSFPPTEDDLANVDCLICHSSNYQRTVVQDEEGEMHLVPADDVDIVAAAQDAQYPTGEMCSRCHLNVSGGPNFNHGDYPTSPDVDVHLAGGIECVHCHATQEHRISGGGYLAVHEVIDVVVACANCHSEEPHTSGVALFMNFHTDRIACQTCHIPLIARDADFPTLLARDYTAPVYDESDGLYSPTEITQSDVMPTYLWWKNHRMDSESRPLGSIDDPGARITPWKLMEVTVPVDAFTGTPINIDRSVYQIQGDLDAAILAGVEASGQEYYSEWEAVATVKYSDVQHQVAPASEALLCSDCHSTEGRLDFAALGYDEAKVTRLVAIRIRHSDDMNCRSCHTGTAPEDHYSDQCSNCHNSDDWTDATVDHSDLLDCASCHAKDAPEYHFDGQCSNCHTGGDWANVDFDHMGLVDCAGCHSDRAPYDHHPGQCSNCHTPTDWSEVSYDHLNAIDCAICHTPPPRHWEQTCTDCHTPTSWDGNYNHLLTDCRLCHTSPPEHYTGQCSDCHNPTYWQDVTVRHSEFTECSGCHSREDHYDSDCSSCHIPISWSQIEVDHDNFIDCKYCHGEDAPLDHYDKQCSTCHNTQNWLQIAVNHSELTDCRACHDQDAPAVHSDAQCSTCHNTVSWLSLDHSTLVECGECHMHKSVHDWPDEYECVDCHAYPDWGDIILEHSGVEDCDACHTPSGDHDWIGECTECHAYPDWSVIVFDHSYVEDCGVCHNPDHDQSWPDECTDCHDFPDWLPTIFDHDDAGECTRCHQAPTGHWPGECIDCHSYTGWGDVDFDHSDVEDCGECHEPTKPEHDWPDECTECHTYTKWEDIIFEHNPDDDCTRCHTPPDGHFPGSCIECHNTSAWKEVTFNHDGFIDCLSCHSGDVPNEPHYVGQCSDCHNSTNYWWEDITFDHDGYTDCQSCHEREDHYSGQCSNCHNTTNWKEISVDHDVYTDCRSCHEKPAEHSPPTNAQCSNCHSTDTWDIPEPVPTQEPVTEPDQPERSDGESHLPPSDSPDPTKGSSQGRKKADQ
jgi:hypothetical protein